VIKDLKNKTSNTNNNQMKKIYIILETGVEILIGAANSIYEWILEIEERIIVPFHGHTDYIIVHKVYNEQYDQWVTYKAVK